MASGLQIKNSFSTSQGYSNGISSGAIKNWTNIGLSGSHTTVVYWDDNYNGNGVSSRVYMTVTDTWSGEILDNNSIKLNIHSSYSMNRTNVRGSSSCSGYYMRDGKVYTNNKSQLLKTYAACITKGGVFSTGSKDWTYTIGHGTELNVGSFYVVNCTRGMTCSGLWADYISAGVAFKNTLPAPPYAPKTNLSCGNVANSTNGKVTFNVSDYGCPSGGSPANACELSSLVEWATDEEFENVVATGTGEKNLAPNTKYYIRATAKNGYYTTTKTCEFTTLATSSVYNYKFYSDQISRLTVQANYGGEACDISTLLQIREKGATSWTDVKTTTVHGTETETLRNLIERGKEYEARTITTNCAGTYTSPIYAFVPPTADSIVGEITSHNDELDASGLSATLDWCYKVTSYTLDEPSEENPIISRLEYRIEGQEEWTTLDTTTSTKSPVTICGSEAGLACGSTYYLRSYQKIGTIESYSPEVKHLTTMCAEVNNCVCDNLTYMTELICQEVARIKEGQKIVYANCSTKELCDPYSNNPTWESILSRIARFSQMVVCLTCSMESLNFAGGKDDEVYTALEPGSFGQFVPLSQTATAESDELISSAAAKKEIEKFLSSTLRPIGTYEFFADSLPDLFDQTECGQESGESGKDCELAEEGDKAVVGQDYYVYENSEWVKKGKVPDLQDLGLVNILKGFWANHEWYWWNDEWNMLDADTVDLERRLSVLENNKDNVVYDEDEDHNNMMIAPITNSNYQIGSLAQAKYPDEQVTVFLYEETTPSSTCFTLDVDLLDSNVGLC